MFDHKIILLAAGICVILILLALRIGYTMALRKMSENSNRAMSRDPLTGMWNRQSFLRLLDDRIQSAERSSTFTVAIININRFRWLNDALGHDLGDLIIKIVGQQIRAAAGEKADIARLNGDEFAFIIDENIERSAVMTAEIVKMFEDMPLSVRGKPIHILASAGLAGYPEHGDSAEVLLTHADTALSRARLTYSCVSAFDPVMNQELHDRFRIATALRFAVQNDELSLAYQPRVDLATGKIAAVEALLRWDHPELGQVSPAEFIPIAEQTGSIVPIGLWVLETACKMAVKWDWDHWDQCRISINISVQQLLSPNFVDTLNDVLARTGLDPRKLELELTESIFIENPRKIIGILTRIRQQGIRIAIDDFGKGYSSLNYLKSYPADTLKIDKDFIRETESTNGQIITDTVIQLARRLGLTVVAEGVELLEQLEFLRSRGCDEVQGYLLCEPMPADQCELFFRQFSFQSLFGELAMKRA